MQDTKDKFISNLLLWMPTHEHTSIDQPAKTYIHQIYTDDGCHLEDLPSAVVYNYKWHELRECTQSACLDDDPIIYLFAINYNINSIDWMWLIIGLIATKGNL